MKNNELTEYKENIFTKIKKFILGIFKKTEIENENQIQEIKEQKLEENNKDLNITDQENKKFSRAEIISLRNKFENEEIDIDDLSEEDMENLINLYNEETEIINKKTEVTREEIKAIKADTKAIKMETELINRKNEELRKKIERIKMEIQQQA